MILTVDIGNTETVVGIYGELEPLHCWRIATDRRRTGDEHALLLRGLLDRALVPEQGPLERAVLCSVVPVMNRAWASACRALKMPYRFVDGQLDLPIRLDVDAPLEVGADRIANTLAASALYARDTVVVDLGTATTFDCIGADGVFRGGVIAPGPRAGMERLARLAAQLPQVEIEAPARVVGRHTRACLDSGIFYSAVESIDGIVRRILEEWKPEDPLVVATGGLAERIATHCACVERIEPFLTLTGLAVADRHLEAPRQAAASEAGTARRPGAPS